MLCALLACLAISPATPYFAIHLVDDQSGRGIPLVELRTVNHLEFVSDSNGYVAFDEPGLMNQKVYFSLFSHGYTYPADGLGYRGVTLHPVAGGAATVKLHRVNIAERLCRLTGAGIYRDSSLLGLPSPLKSPNLNAGVLGQDTAQAEIYRGKMYWFWGDTDRSGYPLGNFHTTGAIATLPRGAASADHGLDFAYFSGGDGFVASMVPSNVSLPIWISGLTVLGAGSEQQMFAYYTQMKRLGEIASSGYVRWDDAAKHFVNLQTFDSSRGWRTLDGHVIQSGDGYVEGQFPIRVRVWARREALLDPSAYQAFTCLGSNGSVQRTADGAADYRWQSELGPISPEAEEQKLAEGQLRPDEVHFLPKDVHGNRIFPHGGSIHWNAYRHKWIMIFTRKGGEDSPLGEIYYAEADAPTGPFRRAVKVITHEKYTFYNPVQHPFLDQEGGRIIYFEGTYSAEFSGNPEKTPLYNYNQILYRLDLGDPRLQFAESN